MSCLARNGPRKKGCYLVGDGGCVRVGYLSALAIEFHAYQSMRGRSISTIYPQ